MKEHDFNKQLKKQIDLFDNKHQVDINTGKLWDQLDKKLHATSKIRLIHLVSAAAILLLFLNVLQFLSNQKVEAKINQLNATYARLENDSQLTKELLKATLEKKENYQKQVEKLQTAHKKIENQLLAERKRGSNKPTTITRYIIAAANEKPRLNEDILLSKPNTSELLPDNDDSATANNDSYQKSNTKTEVSRASLNQPETTSGDKPLFRIQFGNNYWKNPSNNNEKPEQPKKLSINTFL